MKELILLRLCDEIILLPKHLWVEECEEHRGCSVYVGVWCVYEELEWSEFYDLLQPIEGMDASTPECQLVIKYEVFLVNL